jgi:hypothetical protein
MRSAVWRSSRPGRGNVARMLFACALLVATFSFCRHAPAAFFRYATEVDLGSVTPTPTDINVIDASSIEIETAGHTFVDVTGFSLDENDEGNLNADTIGTDILFGRIDVHVTIGSPLESLSIPFTFHVTIEDYPTDSETVPQGTGTFDITGEISGTIGAGLKVNLSTIIIDPITPMLIGDNTYTLSFNENHYAPPGPFFEGRIGTHVFVPEPGTLALFVVGSLALATPALRRWRRKPRPLRI